MLSLWLALPNQGDAETIYRQLGSDGRITYSDKPLGNSAALKPSGGSGTELPAAEAAAGLPYELRQVVSRYPVTLYSGPGCQPCNSARALLQSRGVPFAERTVSTPQDGEALRRISDELMLPVLKIGSQVLKGFSADQYDQYLSLAGYPKTSQLPASYRHLPATPLVEIKKADTAPQPTPAGQLPANENPSNPGGIVF